MFGSDFGDKLIAAGLGGLPISWGDDGSIEGRENLTPEQNAALDAVIAAYNPVEGLRAAKRREISAACDVALAPLAAAYPDREVLSWPQQIAEATVLESDPNAPAPLIRQMAANRPSLGETAEARVAELAQRIRNNAADWSIVAGPIIGKRQALEDQVDAAQTPEEVAAIVVDFGGVS